MLNEANKNYMDLCENIACAFDALKMLYLIYPSYYVNWSQIRRLITIELESFLLTKGMQITATYFKLQSPSNSITNFAS
jgi:hypothetical protein